MPGSSQRWPLTACKQDPSSGQVARLGWPTEQHVLLAQQQVRQSWDTAEGEGHSRSRMGGGARGILRGEAVSTQPAGRGLELRSGTRCSCWFWVAQIQDRADIASVSSGHQAQAEAVRWCFRWRHRVFSTFPCQEPHCWSSKVFSTQPSQLVLGRDLISNTVWNSISPVRWALTMDLPCAWWVMSTLIYCPWVVWKCLKIVSLPHCWALGLYTVTRQKVITGTGPFRGEKSLQKQPWASSSTTDLFKFMWTGTLLTTQQDSKWQKK